MRSSRLIPVLAAAATLFALALASASAASAAPKKAILGGKCHVNLIAEPHTKITSGESVQLFGQLICGGVGKEGQVVTISERTAPSPTFKVIASPTTTAGGFYSFVVSAVTADSFFNARALGAFSGNHVVKVAPVVTLSGPPEGTPLKTGPKTKYTFTGTVSPADVGAEVALQRENASSNEEWVVIQTGKVVAGGPTGGQYTLEHAFGVPGDANLRVAVRPHVPFTVRGLSNVLSYGISQNQNPNLTIHSSANPISFGAPTTISGVDAAGAGQPVTLIGRTAGKKFETLATGTTVAGGVYSFVVAPPKNISYRVLGGKVSSAVLFEGVKYILTAGVSATTVQSGQSLVFSGTVTPGLEKKVVYLERQNTFGGGYHVAGTGEVSAIGTYSITKFVFGAGKTVFRVKVPGDPSNQAATSTTFPTEVTPAPPGSLKPVTPDKSPH